MSNYSETSRDEIINLSAMKLRVNPISSKGLEFPVTLRTGSKIPVSAVQITKNALNLKEELSLTT